ncbi:hypothetical protein B0H13DRAFT_2317342 [Mycena leptocephala]|nr:hypothetical protein B0H13DRAFT_2317342 [Mycena leptocephala]
MDSNHRFPNELWLEVTAQLPSDAIRNLSSADRALYDIARSLGFTEFKLYPYPYDFQPQKAQLDDALQRLDFWSSPNIAPHVRSCTARSNAHRWQGSAQLHDGGSPHILMNTFFELLPRFTGLQRLYADWIQFTQMGLASLCGLPTLTHVELSGCTVAAGEYINPDSLTLRVATFIARYDYDMNDLWISLLSRDSLQELNFSDLLVFTKPGVLPFPNVQTLTMNSLPMRISDTLAILAKFPGVRVISSGYTPVLRSLTPLQESSIFPVLEKYTGAYENLQIFVQRPTLTHIAIDASSPCSKLLTELRGVTALPNISSLTVRFLTSSENLFGQAQVDALFTLFPRLTELQMTLYPHVEEDGRFTPLPTTFLKMLAAAAILPSTLESLSLTWDFPFEYGSTDSAAGNDPAPPNAAEIPGFAGLREELIAKCGALAEVFLDGYHFLFWWQKVEWDGTAREATAYSYDDAERLRAQKTELEYGPFSHHLLHHDEEAVLGLLARSDCAASFTSFRFYRRSINCSLVLQLVQKMPHLSRLEIGNFKETLLLQFSVPGFRSLSVLLVDHELKISRELAAVHKNGLFIEISSHSSLQSIISQHFDY